YSSFAVSSSARHDRTSGRRRSRARRSRSVIPPQTPNSIRLSRASARHSVRTGQPRQMSLARFCAAPCTNRASGSALRQAARAVQSVIHILAPLPWGLCRFALLGRTGADVRPPNESRGEELTEARDVSTVPGGPILDIAHRGHTAGTD